MKRILSLFIVLMLILGTLASCDLFKPAQGNEQQQETTVTTPQPTEPPHEHVFVEGKCECGETDPNYVPPVVEADIQDALDLVEDMYEDLNSSSISSNYELIAQIKVGKTVFSVTWTADNSDVSFENRDGMIYVILPKVTEDVSLTLTASLASPEGQEAEISFNTKISAVATNYGRITNPETGVAYKLALRHGGQDGDPIVYFDGENYNGYAWYLNYTADPTIAVDVYLEEVEDVEGGLRLYFYKDDVKTYIVAFPRDGDTTQGTLKLDTAVPSEYYTFSEEYKTLIYTSVTGEQFFIGSSGTFKSISCSSISYITNATNYPICLWGPNGEDIELPEEVLPTVPDNYTSADLVDVLYQLLPGQTLEGPFTITGKVTSIKYAYDPGYNNISVNIVVEGKEDKPVLLYRLNCATYEGADKLKVGDTVTASINLTNYNGTYETTSGGVILNIVVGEDTPVVPPVTNDDVVVLDMMGSTNIQSHSATQMVYAANGITLTNNKNTSSTDCYNNTGTYAARFYGGATIKIEYPGMTKIVLTLDDYSPEAGKDYLKGFDGMTVEGATITRDNDIVTIIFDAATDVFQSAALGSQVRVEKIEVYTGEVEGGGNGGDDPVVTPNYTAPVAGQPYKFAMELPSGKVYFAGSMSGDYLATTTDASAAVAIYFEEVTGGYHIFFMDGETKTYITAAAYLKSNGYPGCHFSLTTETPTLVWTYNTTYGIIEIYDEVSGKSDTFFAGTYGSYSTISLSGAYYKDQIASGTQYPARIELVEGGEILPPDQGGEGGETPDPHEHNFVDGKCECGEVDPNYQAPDDGENDGLMSIPEVLAAAEGTVVKFTGTVHSFYEEWSSYGNCSPYIVDEAGNKILVFRTSTKVTIGDVVTVEGKVTLYSNVNQIDKEGSKVTIDVAHVCSSWTAATCGKDSACVICGAAGSEKATGNHTFEDGICSVCGASAASMKLLGTLSFSSTSNRTTFTTSQQVWAANGITLTNDKGSSTSNVADYHNPARFYKSSKLTIEATGILKIEFTCNSSSYATALASSLPAGTTSSVSGSVVTVTFAEPVDSFVINSLTGGQVRMNSLTVYVAE